MKNTLRNSLLAYIVTSIVGLPFCSNMALADSLDMFNQSSSSGVDFGKLIQNGVKANFDQSSGQVSSGGQDVIVYKGPDDGMSNVKSAYGNKTALGGLVSSTANKLDGENSDAGNAYRTLMGGANQRRPNLEKDVIVKNGQSVLRKTFNDPASSGCYTTIQSSTIDSGSTHIEDVKYCDRLTIKEPQCKVWREIDMVRPVTFISGDGHGSDINLSTFQMVLGADKNNNLNSKKRCSYYRTSIKIRVNNPEAIQSVSFVKVAYDDRIRIKFGADTVFTGPDGNFNPTPSSCELNTSFREYPTTDLTPYFTSKSPGEMVDASIEVLYQGGGEGYAQINVKYKEPKQTIHQDPPGCLDEIKADPDFLGGPHPSWTKTASIDDQASNGYWQCKNASNAFLINVSSGGTYTVTPNDYDFLGPLFPDEPVAPPAPICFEAELRKLGTYTECQDDSGNPNLCTTRDWKSGDVVDTCSKLKADPSCIFLETKCDQYSAGVCTGYKDYYDCGVDVPIKSIVNSETVVCPGNISCMGESCGVPHGTEKNARFNDAAVAMEVVKNSNMDGKCDQNTGGDCRIFSGELFTCKKVLGGMQDCCQVDLPPGPSMVDYMKLTKSTWELAKDTELGKDLAQMGNGAWNGMSSAASDLTREISQPLMSAWDSFAGTAAGSTDAIGAGVDVVATGAEAVTAVTETALTTAGSQTITSQLSSYVFKWAAETFGETIAGSTGSLFIQDAAGSIVLNVAGNMIAAFLSVVMWIYLIYQIITILVALIWPCTDDEFSLASKKQMRVCHYMGTKKKKSLGMSMSETRSYCCFAAPFARIIHEQTRDKPEQPLLDKPWGPIDNPDCSGFTLNQFSTIDFGKVDLSEWLAMLRLAEMTPTTAEQLNRDLGVDKAGSKKLGENSYSATTMDRAKALINHATGGSDTALDERRNELGKNAREDALYKK